MTPPGLATESACRCGARLRLVEDLDRDEFVWRDEQGLQVVPCDPSWFRVLSDLEDHVSAHPEDSQAAGDYSVLVGLVRSGTAPLWHHHLPEDIEAAHVSPPWCCGWPARLRPSGWYCRDTGRQIETPESVA